MINAAWNILGRVGPVFIAVAATHPLIQQLGLVRWGIFTIALSLVGSFGIFDFGLGRALTKTLAEHIARGEQEAAASITITGIIALGILGSVGGILAALCVQAWVHHGLKIPPDLQRETIHAMWVLCATAPLVMVNAAMWGVISAYQKFKAANLINIPISMMYYIGPLLVSRVTPDLVLVMLTLAACRLVMTFAYAWLCFQVMPSLFRTRPVLALMRPLIRLGSWMTVSNLTMPLLTYMDRFVIASVLSAAVTSFYTTPFDAVIRLTIISGAIMNTAFPAMAGSWRVDPKNTVEMYRRCVLTIAALLFPAALACTMFSGPILSLWLGPTFAENSALVMKCLGIGVLLFGFDAVVSGLLDAIGRPDVNAKFSVAELVLYVPVLAYMLHLFGITGAAIAWLIRSLIDCGARTWLSARLYPPVAPAALQLAPVVIVGIAMLCASFLVSGLQQQIIATLVIGPAFCLMLWFRGLTQGERHAVLDRLSRVAPVLRVLAPRRRAEP